MRHPDYKPLLYLGYFLFGILGMLSIYYFKERTCYDGANYLFCAINNKWFCLFQDRWILVFSQILPLIGVYLNLSLKAIMILHSLGNILFFFALFLMVICWNQDVVSGLALALLQILAVSFSFFIWPMAEVHYSIGFIFLLHSIILYQDLSRG